MLGVVPENSCAKLDLTASLADPFTHLQRRIAGKLVGALMQGCSGSFDDGRPLCKRPPSPRLVAGRSGRNRGLELAVGELGEGLRYFAVVRIYALIGHLVSA